MTSQPDPAGRLFVAWVRAVRRGAWAVVILSLLAVAGSLAYLGQNLRISTDTEDMLSRDLPFRQNNREINRQFPQLVDNLLIVLDGQVPEQVDRAAMDLVQRLRQAPGFFGPVFDPAGDPVLQANGLLLLGIEELERLTGRLADAQPFLASLWAAPDLITLFDLLRQGLDRPDGGEVPAEMLAPVLDRLAKVAEQRRAGEAAILSWQRLLNGGEAEDGAANARRLIVLRPPLDFGALQPAGPVLDRLAVLGRELGFTTAPGDAAAAVRMRLSGSVALAHDELLSVERGMGLAGALSLVLVVGLLVVALRSASSVLAVLMSLIAGLIWTAGFAIAAVGALNLISVAFAVLFIGLSVDFGIHFALRYAERRQAGQGRDEALEAAAAEGGGGLTLCAVAAAIAFYSFLPTDYVGLAQLGVIAGTGMFIALFANLTLLPALLAVLPARDAADLPAPGGMAGGLGGWARRVPRRILFGAGLIAVIGLALLPQARFDFDPLNLQDSNLPSVAVIHELAEDPSVSAYGATVLAPDRAAAGVLADRLRRLPEVTEVTTINRFLPGDQGEKREVIDDLALFLLPSLTGDPAKPRTDLGTIRKSLAMLVATLKRTAKGEDDRPLAAAADRLAMALQGLPDESLSGLQTAYLSTLPDTFGRLRRAMSPTGLTLESLPEDLKRRYLAADGTARIVIGPKDDMRRPEAVTRFVEALRGVAPQVAGAPVTILEAGRAVLRSFFEAGAIAVTAILVFLFAILRRPTDVLLVFAPLVLAALLTAAFSTLVGVPFNFANVIVLPLLFGLGVASGIHLILRDRQAGAGALTTSTPRAVLFSALTTIGSFGSIALSGHPGTASMGILLTAAIAMTLVSTLVMLPACLALRRGPGGPER